MARRALVLLALLLPSAPADAARFIVTTTGALPAVAVDNGGTAHVVWNTTKDGTSTTSYCRVPKGSKACAAHSLKTFSPADGDEDFAGPRVFVSGSRVTVVFARCCTGAAGPDDADHATRVYVVRSADGGTTFGAPAWIGTVGPDLGMAFSRGSLVSLGTVDGGIALQSAPLAGFSGGQNLVASDDAPSGGIGVSSKGSLAAYESTSGLVRVGAVKGDPNKAKPAFRTVGKGTDVRVASGPRGVDVLYLTKGRYVVRRYANGKLGGATAVSEAGVPIFGSLVQDDAGRVHAAWIGARGLTYRRSAGSGSGFGRARTLAALSGDSDYADVAIGANASGRAAVVYATSATAGRVVGYTTG